MDVKLERPSTRRGTGRGGRGRGGSGGRRRGRLQQRNDAVPQNETLKTTRTTSSDAPAREDEPGAQFRETSQPQPQPQPRGTHNLTKSWEGTAGRRLVRRRLRHNDGARIWRMLRGLRPPERKKLLTVLCLRTREFTETREKRHDSKSGLAAGEFKVKCGGHYANTSWGGGSAACPE